MSGSIQALIAGYGGATLGGKLDAYLANIWGVYSCLYLLRGAYIGGPLIRVRHTGGTETDIGHDGVGFLDTAALATAAGGGTLTVAKVYDQSGNARDLVQGTTTAQPRIVDSGTFDKGMVFDGTTDFFATPSIASGAERTVLSTHQISSQPIAGATTYAVFEMNTVYTSNGAGYFWSDNVDGSGLDGSRILTGDGTHRADVYFSGYSTADAAIFDRAQSVNTNQIKVVTSAGSSSLGAGPNLTSPVPSNNFDAAAMYIGARAGTSLFAPMKLQNLVIYTAAKSVADMTAATALIPLYT